MTASITHNGTRYEGKTAQSIARRVWGRTAEVRISPDPNNRWPGTMQAVICRTDRHGTHVLAQVVVRSEED